MIDLERGMRKENICRVRFIMFYEKFIRRRIPIIIRGLLILCVGFFFFHIFHTTDFPPDRFMSERPERGPRFNRIMASNLYPHPNNRPSFIGYMFALCNIIRT
jgi:hypothetical protein